MFKFDAFQKKKVFFDIFDRLHRKKEHIAPARPAGPLT